MADCMKFLEPAIKMNAIPIKPSKMWLTETVATMTAPTGEKLEICRPINNPFIVLIRGAVNECEIDLADFIQSVAVKIVGPDPLP